jgi:hypothetical protein
VSFQLPASEQYSEDFYQNYMGTLIFEMFRGEQREELTHSIYWFSGESGSTHCPITLTTKAVGIYGLVMSIGSETQQSYMFSSDVAVAGDDGVIHLYGTSQKPKFMEAFDTNTPLVRQSALLVRFTGEVEDGKLGYEIVPPEQIQME